MKIPQIESMLAYISIFLVALTTSWWMKGMLFYDSPGGADGLANFICCSFVYFRSYVINLWLKDTSEIKWYSARSQIHLRKLLRVFTCSFDVDSLYV
ncbi:MAG: hypothetical protein CM1200mP3_11710 [Chloroflexota bacterium]|nr:MAG: hypothetical protein CM1200mP3_11710 [Chloroflexota bacterium]